MCPTPHIAQRTATLFLVLPWLTRPRPVSDGLACLAQLVQRPGYQDVIGPGVSAFTIGFTNGWEPNWPAIVRQTGMDLAWAKKRCDIIVFRVDGSALRLHPSSSGKEAILTHTQQPNLWDPDDPHVRTGGRIHQAADACQEHAFSDNISAPNAYATLSAVLGGTGHRASLDVTEGRAFAWKRFLQARPDGVTLLSYDVRSVRAMWWRQCPCLEVRVHAYDDPVWISLNGRSAKFHWPSEQPRGA